MSLTLHDVGPVALANSTTLAISLIGSTESIAIPLGQFALLAASTVFTIYKVLDIRRKWKREDEERNEKAAAAVIGDDIPSTDTGVPTPEEG